MSKAYMPPFRFNVAFKLLIPKSQSVNGVLVKKYPSPEFGILFFGSFRSFGGTETTINGIYSIISTAVVETWFDPKIKSDCRIEVNNEVYEILGEPENINLTNQYMKLKVKLIKGGA